MKLKPWAVIGLLLAAPLAALAQPTQRAPGPADPADPGVPVAPLVFESVIAAPPAPEDPALTPDKRWRTANEAVAAPPPMDHGKHHHDEEKR